MAQGTTKGVPIDIDPTLSADNDSLVPSQKAIKSYIDLGLSNKVSRNGDTMLGNLILNANPTLALQAVTKDYVDTLINGIDWKQAVNATTVSGLPSYNVSSFGQILTGTLNGAIPSGTTDGITLVANQRLLVKNETLINTPNNGIYVVTQAGSPSTPFILTRASDSNTPTLLAEATVSVSFGNSLSNTQWHCNPASVPIVIGTTYITFTQIGSGVYSFSPPLVDTGNIISIPAATNSVNGYLTSTDWSIFNNKQDSLGFTPENEANKENITLDTSTTKYPTNNLVKTNIDTKVTANSAITGDTKTKITYDSKGLVTSGTDLTASDIPSGITATKISNGIITNTEFDFLSGVTSNIQTQIDTKASTTYVDTNDKKFEDVVVYVNGQVDQSVYFDDACSVTKIVIESTISTLQYNVNGGSFTLVDIVNVNAGSPINFSAASLVVWRITYGTPSSTSKGVLFYKANKL